MSARRKYLKELVCTKIIYILNILISRSAYSSRQEAKNARVGGDQDNDDDEEEEEEEDDKPYPENKSKTKPRKSKEVGQV